MSTSKFVVCALALIAVGVFASAALAQQVTLTSTVPQSGFRGLTIGPPGFPLTATPYTFGAQEVEACASIESLSVTSTLFDADTGQNEADFNDLTLALDGIDTEVALNGFAADEERSQSPVLRTTQPTS